MKTNTTHQNPEKGRARLHPELTSNTNAMKSLCPKTCRYRVTIEHVAEYDLCNDIPVIAFTEAQAMAMVNAMNLDNADWGLIEDHHYAGPIEVAGRERSHASTSPVIFREIESPAASEVLALGVFDVAVEMIEIRETNLFVRAHSRTHARRLGDRRDWKGATWHTTCQRIIVQYAVRRTMEPIFSVEEQEYLPF